MRAFTYYWTGECYAFTCWNATHTSCGCHSVDEDKLEANIVALQESGYVDMSDKRWDFSKKEWVPYKKLGEF